MANTQIRTRIAPSPTGIPHLGTTRTALFSYLLAKKYHGQFILRLEDTDQKRFVKGSPAKIYQLLQFLNLTPDEDYIKGGPFSPYIQTKRLKIYQKYTQKLLDLGVAYKDKGAVRLKMPQKGYTAWKDLVQGKISIPNQEVDNKVILKSNGIPTYHLAATIDDHLMKITHVLRGVEWISSTPAHLLIYQALNWPPPLIGHLPLLLGPDKSKLSKRHGAKSVFQLKDQGYLPQAINNCLFYLGFSYQDNSALLTLKQMIKIFNQNKIQKQNAIFDLQKLNYFNSRWIKKLDNSQLIDLLIPFIPESWSTTPQKLSQIIPLIKDQLFTLQDIAQTADIFFCPPKVSRQALLKQSEQNPTVTKDWLNQTLASLSKNKNKFTSDNIHQDLKSLQQKSSLTPRQAFMTIRLALTNKTVTPPIFDVVAVLGLAECKHRLNRAIKSLT